MINLNEIPGIGTKTISLIEEKIGNSRLNKFHDNLKNLQFSMLFSLNLDQKIEQEIIKHCVSNYYQFEYQDSLIQNSHVKKMFHELLSLIRRQFVLDVNKKELISFSATTNLTEIARRQKIVSLAISFFSKFEPEKIKVMQELLKVEKLNSKLNTEIVILCDEEDLYLKLKNTIKENASMDVSRKINVIWINSRDEFEAYKNYDLIRYAYTNESKLICDVEECDNVISIKWKNNIYDLIPELLYLEFLGAKEILKSVHSLIFDLGIPSDPIEKEILTSVISSLDEESKETTNLSKEEIVQFRKYAEKLVELELKDTQISGMELLKLLKSPVNEHLLLRGVVERVKEKLAEKNKSALKLLSFETIIPEIDEEQVLIMRQEKERNKAEASFNKNKDFYNRFISDKGIILACQQFLERIDFLIGMGLFFSKSSVPRINCNKKFSCMDLKSTVLSSKEKGVQAITYYLDRSQTILTGANSGGKTSLLQLLTETQLLTQMGLFVSGSAQVPLYDNIHFFTKSSGTVGSGAFETTLKDLSNIAENSNSGKTLVLLDEIESITEPGAAGQLIAATLEWFERKENIDVVLVSHLGDVLKDICPNARIDGIEAVALDDSLRLVVDRNPKIGVLARSTPQLIVEKLSRQEEENAYFAFLKEKMGAVNLESGDSLLLEVNTEKKKVEC